MIAEEEQVTADEVSDADDTPMSPGGGDEDSPKKGKRSKPRRQSGTAVAFQKRAGVRKIPERTTSNHLVERKGRGNELKALTGVAKLQDRRGSQGAIKAATSAMRAARGVPSNRGVSRAASSQQAPRRPDRTVAPGRKKVPARSNSSHGLKEMRKKGQGTEPTLSGADLLNLRKAQKADSDAQENCDGDSVQSDVDSTYTMDSINLRKSQIYHDDGKLPRRTHFVVLALRCWRYNWLAVILPIANDFAFAKLCSCFLSIFFQILHNNSMMLIWTMMAVVMQTIL